MLLAVLEGVAHWETGCKKRQSSKLSSRKAPLRSLSTSTAPGCQFHPLLYLDQSCRSWVIPWKSFKLLHHPLASKGQQDTFGPHCVATAPKSPTSKVSQEKPFSCVQPRWSGGFTLAGNRADNNTAKQGTKLNTSTATGKLSALLHLSSQPGLPGTCQAQ